MVIIVNSDNMHGEKLKIDHIIKFTKSISTRVSLPVSKFDISRAGSFVNFLILTKEWKVRIPAIN